MSYIKAIDVYFIISFFFVFGAVGEYVIVRLHTERKLKGPQKDNSIDMEMMPLKQVTLKCRFKNDQIVIATIRLSAHNYSCTITFPLVTVAGREKARLKKKGGGAGRVIGFG